MPVRRGNEFWQNPDYSEVYMRRQRMLNAFRSDPTKLAAAKVYYRNNIVDFIDDWGMTFDPRNVEIGLPTSMPFVLFDKQREWINWVIDNWRNRQDCLTEKSRDMGLSWLSVALAASLWIFEPGFVCGFGSRKEEYVDKLDSPKALFWKLRQFINLLPPEFQPSEWESPFMRVVNKDNNSYIVGESGDNIGRGDRASLYFIDEAAFLPNQKSVDAALSQTANCKIYVSTPNGNGNAFYEKRFSGRYPVFTFHWRDDPRKGEEWYRKQQETLDPVVLAQEVDIDYNASTGDRLIDALAVDEAQRYGVADIEAIGPLVLGVDVAHMGDDESVITPRRGRVCYDQLTFRKMDGAQLAGEIMEFVRESPEPVAAIIIELDGPGTSVYDALRNTSADDMQNLANIVVGVHTGARVSNGKDLNLRAKMYRELDEWLKEGQCRLPKDNLLKSQLTSIPYRYKDGLRVLAPKREMKRQGFSSPDRADSLALTFAATPPNIGRSRPTMAAIGGRFANNVGVRRGIRQNRAVMGRPGHYRRRSVG